jgi:hypothetical protein
MIEEENIRPIELVGEGAILFYKWKDLGYSKKDKIDSM